MPWSEKQMHVAQAVAHGWKPTGSAKGFTKGFAEQVVEEGVKGGKKKRRATLGDLTSMKLKEK